MRHVFVATSVAGVARCRCGVERMVVLRMNNGRPTLRAFCLYRQRFVRGAGAPRGVLSARGWTHWSTLQPRHA